MNKHMFKASAFIDGEVINDSELKEYQLFSAFDGQLIGSIPLLNEKYQRKIFQSSKSAFKKWSQVDHETREKFLFLFGSKLREYQNLLVQLIHLESGKSKAEAEKELTRSIEYITESIHAFHELHKKPKEFSSERYPLVPENLHAIYFRVPLGVVLSITPFNYPLNTVITKIVPAILMGNTVIQKSSMKGALTGWLICKIFNELKLDGFLITPGVLNYYTGSGSELEKFIEKEKLEIAALSFTGSSKAGLSISKSLPGIPQALELSALNVALVLENAELELSVKEILKGAFELSGQRCTSIKLVCVPKTIQSYFEDLISRELSALNKAPTPIVNLSVFDQMKYACEDALDSGAKAICSPVSWDKIEKPYLPNVILSDVTFDMNVAKEELFGPILGIIPYDNLEETIEKINNLGYGLQASVFGSNLEEAGEIAYKIDVGRVNINMCPARSPDFLPFPSSRKSGNSEQGIVNSLYFFSKFRGIVYHRIEENSEDTLESSQNEEQNQLNSESLIENSIKS